MRSGPGSSCWRCSIRSSSPRTRRRWTRSAAAASCSASGSATARRRTAPSASGRGRAARARDEARRRPRLLEGEASPPRGRATRSRTRGSHCCPCSGRGRRSGWRRTRRGGPRAARVGDAWFVNPHTTVDELERQLGSSSRERGARPAELPAIRECCVAPTDEEAIESARPFLDEVQGVRRLGPERGAAATDTLRREWDELRAGRFIVGSPDTAAAQIREHRDRLGITLLLCGCSGRACRRRRRSARSSCWRGKSGRGCPEGPIAQRAAADTIHACGSGARSRSRSTART